MSTNQQQQQQQQQQHEQEEEFWISSYQVHDVRYPTDEHLDGSDAMNKSPRYSIAYLVVDCQTSTGKKFTGTGSTFTIGRGTELCVAAIKSIFESEKCTPLGYRFSKSAKLPDSKWFMRLTGDSQLRWIGPEAGCIHLACAAVNNAVWDSFAKFVGKPLWRAIVDLSPEQIVSLVPFRYITDFLTPEDALEILKKNEPTKNQRIDELEKKGVETYSTSSGWLGYSEEKLRRLATDLVEKEGMRVLKIKVGQCIEDDKRRCRIIREVIGPDRMLFLDANQVWSVPEAVEWVAQLAEFKPRMIEEPTAPSDILGHKEISERLKPLGIGVASGEHCQNRIVFKQFLKVNALDFVQTDTCRLAGPNELLAVYLMAKKAGANVMEHSGGVGLPELVCHWCWIDVCSIRGTNEGRLCEHVNHLHEEFVNPCKTTASFGGCRFVAPSAPGYSTELKQASLEKFEFPNGTYWQEKEKKEKQQEQQNSK